MAATASREASKPSSRIVGVEVLDAKRLRFHRRALVLASVLPLTGFALAVWSLWGRGFSPTDAGIAGGFYVLTGLGVTVGFHRLLAHRTFEAPSWVRVVLAIAGSMSIEMSAISWVATHRRHHAYSDRPGDPHSPHLDAASGIRGVARGLWYAHMGWLFAAERTSKERWAPDLLKDRGLVAVDRAFPLLVLASFVLPAIVGAIVTQSVAGTVGAFVWGGLARIFLLHHVTFSINSLCHFYGRRPYETREKSTNFSTLALLSFGESWHNNHHAFPASSSLGLRWWQLDPGDWMIRALTRLRLAERARRPSRDELLAARRAAA
jgi:stearoyl-CoA desaturase (delta-9 desaturase)